MKLRTLDLGLFVLRVGMSLMLLTHGWGKFNRLFADEIKFGDPIGLGSTTSLYLVVLAEFIAPLFIIVGFKTRWMALFPVAAMAVAAFIVHAEDPFSRQEKALLFFCGFLAILLCGAGRFAMDTLLRNKI
jgi:putative oxidoreductase